MCKCFNGNKNNFIVKKKSSNCGIVQRGLKRKGCSRCLILVCNKVACIWVYTYSAVCTKYGNCLFFECHSKRLRSSSYFGVNWLRCGFIPPHQSVQNMLSFFELCALLLFWCQHFGVGWVV